LDKKYKKRKMKKIFLAFLMLFVIMWATAQGTKPSGVFSLNGQQTVGNNNIYYATVVEYLAFLCDGVLPGGITNWNGVVVENTKVSHDRAFFEGHVNELQLTAVTQTNKQLVKINEDNNNTIFTNPTVSKYRGYIKNHMVIMDLEFMLSGSDSVVWMLGEYGDFTKGKFVKHAKADGKYFVMKVNNNKLYVIARVSCFNNVTLKETLWLQTGVAKLRNQPSNESDRGEDYNDPSVTPKPRKIRVNGEEVATTDANGDININVAGGNATIGDSNVKGGSSNNINSNGGGTTSNVNEPIQTPWGPATSYERQERYDVVDGVHIDRAAQYYRSLGSSNPNNGLGVLGNVGAWLFGNNCNGYGFYNQGGQNFCVGGNWGQGNFQPNWNQCYQWGNNGWGLNVGFGLGNAQNSTFCGGYNGNNWVAPTQQCWGTTPRSTVNQYYTNHSIPPVSRGGFQPNGTGTPPQQGGGFQPNGTGMRRP
jgi:hypothetical protein